MLGVLAEDGGTPPPAQNNFGDTMSDGLAGPMALLIIVLLAIATVLLIRNMNSRLRRLPDRFPVPAAHPSSTGAAPATAGTDDHAAGPTATGSSSGTEPAGDRPGG